LVFSKPAGCRSPPGLDQARGNRRALRCGRVRRTVGRGRTAERLAEARGERADAAQADGEADLRDAAVGVPKERGSPFQPPREQVLVWALPKGAPELPAEVRLGEVCGPGQGGHVEGLA